MKVTTSSRKSYNHLALRGNGVDDMEFVEQFGLDPAVAYTPAINDAMLDVVYNQNIEAGVDHAQAERNRATAAKELKSLMAAKGMLK